VVGGAVARIAARLEVEQDNDDREDDAHWTGADPRVAPIPAVDSTANTAKLGKGEEPIQKRRIVLAHLTSQLRWPAARRASRRASWSSRAAEAAGQPPQRRGNAEDRADHRRKAARPGAS
jgi:hypothetical protein